MTASFSATVIDDFVVDVTETRLLFERGVNTIEDAEEPKLNTLAALTGSLAIALTVTLLAVSTCCAFLVHTCASLGE